MHLRRKAMPNALQGKNVVILGGSSDIGVAVAALAAEQGAVVFAFSQSGKAPASVHGVKTDVSSREALVDAFSKIGQIDHLAHTVGLRSGSTPGTSRQEALSPAAFE